MEGKGCHLEHTFSPAEGPLGLCACASLSSSHHHQPRKEKGELGLWCITIQKSVCGFTDFSST